MTRPGTEMTKVGCGLVALPFMLCALLVFIFAGVELLQEATWLVPVFLIGGVSVMMWRERGGGGWKEPTAGGRTEPLPTTGPPCPRCGKPAGAGNFFCPHCGAQMNVG